MSWSKPALVRNWVFALTVAAWLWLCWTFWQQLILQASNAREIYARAPSFQAVNFVVQYLWFFALLLAVILLVEWFLLRMAGRVLSRTSNVQNGRRHVPKACDRRDRKR